MATNYCTTAEVKADLGITGSSKDVLIDAIVEAVSDAIDEDCEREGRLYYRQVEELFDIVSTQRKYHPRNGPVVSVSGHQIKQGPDDFEEDTSREVFAYGEYIEFDTPIFSSGGSGSNFTAPNMRLQGLKVDMRIGFFDENEIPKGLNVLARQVSGKELQKMENQTSGELKSKKIGNFAVSYATAESKETMKQNMENNGLYVVLNKYRKGLNYGML